MSETAAKGTVRAVGRALALLDVFAEEHAVALPLSTLVRASALPRTTVLRLVETLVAEQLLEYGEDGQVIVGPRLGRWAMFSDAVWRIPAATQDRLAQLASATGETVSVYTRSGSRRLAVAQAPAPSSLRHVVRVGDRLPLWRGASALVLLAFDTRPGGLEQAYASFRDEPGAPEQDELFARVALVAEAGWAVTHGERERGISGVAVPLITSTRPVALAVGGPTTRFTPECVELFVAELQRAAVDIRQTGLPSALTAT